MKTFYFFLLALLIGSNSFAGIKTGTISGSIVDEQHKPIDYVTIGLFRASDSTLVKTSLTNPEGKFEFVNVAAGNYFIKVSMMGYANFKGKVFTLEENQANLKLIEIRLQTTSKALNTVNVTATKPLIERRSDKLVMNVENSSILVGSTALEVLQKAPGVTVDQNDNISMQGKKGVLIMIDGKLTYMSNADVANLLRNMQSSQLETIELITNPSSKYDASGNAGIINIRTKKGRNGGTNGSVYTGLSYGKNLKENAGLNVNHRTKALNLFGNYNYNHNKNEGTITIDRISNGAPDTYFMQVGDTYRKRENHNFKLGLDLFLNKKNTLGFLVNGYRNSGTEFSDNSTLIGPSFTKVDSSLTALSNQNSSYRNIAYNINYKTILDTAGSELSIDADYSRYHGNELAIYTNDYLFANGTKIRPIVNTRNETPAVIGIKAVKADYNVALTKKLKLEAGLKSSWVETDNNLRAEEFKAGAWQNDVRRSNQFVYDENVNAAYTNLQQQFKSTSIQIGLRVEQTNSKGNLITTNNVVERSYWDLFPTFFLQQTLNKNNQVGFSYSRRIDRPSYDALNPFVYYLDQYTYNKGNPFLNPQYTHNFEINYTFMQKYLLSINYSRTNDAITEVLLPDEVQKALYQTYANVAKNVAYGANINVPVKVIKGWEMNNNLNVFYLSFQSPNLAGKPLKTGKTSFQFKTQQSFVITDGLTAELNGNYDSPVDYGTLSLKSRYSLDAGLSKSLFNKKASLKLALSDVFNTNDSDLSSAYPGLSYTLHQKNESQVGRVSFTYRFGKNEIKPARRRSTGTESEQGRIKN